MKQFNSFLILALVSLLSSAVLADVVPTQMNFQGVLTDTGGNPISDSTKSVQFTIYDAATNGNLLWAETLNVTTDNQGRFTVILGKIYPLYGAIFSDTSRYLGVKVGNDPEISPRAKISSVAYSLRTRAIHGAFGGTLAGPPGQGAELYLDNGSGLNGVAAIGEAGFGEGGGLYISDEVGNNTFVMEPDFDGSGGYFSIGRSTTNSGFFVDGNYNGTNNPRGGFLGSFWSAIFNMDGNGDNTVSLPAGAIHSTEIFNEPGIAANNNSSTITLNTSGMVDLVTTSITIPEAGYVVVEGKCIAELSGTTGSNKAAVQIDQTAGGLTDGPYAIFVGETGYLNTSVHDYPVYVTRVYYFSTPGTQTFRMEGIAYNLGGGALTRTSWHQITATYYPTAYGSVITAVSANEASQFEQATPIPQREIPGLTAAVPSEQMYQVDLRELEIKALKARAEAEKAQRELIEAQLKQQMEKSQASTPNLEQNK